jgi:hypothetical protein
MGRSYSEYPFHEQQPMLGVQGSGPRLGNDEDQQKLGQQKAQLPDMPPGYRQPHAETIQRYQRRAARRAAGGSGARGGGQAATAKKAASATKKAPVKKAAAKKAAPTVAKAAPTAKKMVSAKPASAAKPAPAAAKGTTPRAGVTTSKTPLRGGKTLTRVAAAAKTLVGVAKKVASRKATKKR